ncbi:DNA double-strand break repair Rad50 atpase, partial [Entamoeba invadens IP1]
IKGIEEKKKKAQTEVKEKDESMTFEFGGQKDPLFESDEKEFDGIASGEKKKEDNENDEDCEEEERKKVNIKIEMKERKEAKKVKAISFGFGEKIKKVATKIAETSPVTKDGLEDVKKAIRLIENNKLDDAENGLRKCAEENIKSKNAKVLNTIRAYYVMCEILEFNEMKESESGIVLNEILMSLPLLKPHRRCALLYALSYFKKTKMCGEGVIQLCEKLSGEKFEVTNVKSVCWKCGKERIGTKPCGCGEKNNIVCSGSGISLGGDSVWKCKACGLTVSGEKCILCGSFKSNNDEVAQVVVEKKEEMKIESKSQNNSLNGFNDFGGDVKFEFSSGGQNEFAGFDNAFTADDFKPQPSDFDFNEKITTPVKTAPTDQFCSMDDFFGTDSNQHSDEHHEDQKSISPQPNVDEQLKQQTQQKDVLSPLPQEESKVEKQEEKRDIVEQQTVFEPKKEEQKVETKTEEKIAESPKQETLPKDFNFGSSDFQFDMKEPVFGNDFSFGEMPTPIESTKEEPPMEDNVKVEKHEEPLNSFEDFIESRTPENEKPKETDTILEEEKNSTMAKKGEDFFMDEDEPYVYTRNNQI